MHLSNLALLFLTLLISIPPTLSAYITFPLYINPSNNAWAPLYNAIASNPGLLFQLIINPASGPGTTTYPSAAYITALTKLHTYPNVQLLGYVHISYGARAQSDVQSDISLYAGWSGYTAGNIKLDGIFFDEAPDRYTTANYNYLSSVASYARAKFPGGHLNTNPGVVCDSRYFSLVDTVNVFEDYYSSYGSRTLNNIPVALRPKSTIIIHNFNGNANKQTSLVQTIAGGGVSGMYITTTRGYTSFSNLWNQFVTAMAATSG
jgi:hypothetical protein